MTLDGSNVKHCDFNRGGSPIFFQIHHKEFMNKSQPQVVSCHDTTINSTKPNHESEEYTMKFKVVAMMIGILLFGSNVRAQEWETLRNPYHYHFAERRSLTLDGTLIAVKFTPASYHSAQALENALSRISAVANQVDSKRVKVVSGPRGEYLCLIRARAVLSTVDMIVLLKQISRIPEVEYASPALRDQDNYQVTLTDEFAVKLRVDAENSTWQKLMRAEHLTARKSDVLPDVYFVRVSRETKKDVLTACNSLFEQYPGLVEWCDLN
jgi:hypothetical protein